MTKSNIYRQWCQANRVTIAEHSHNFKGIYLQWCQPSLVIISDGKAKLPWAVSIPHTLLSKIQIQCIVKVFIIYVILYKHCNSNWYYNNFVATARVIKVDCSLCNIDWTYVLLDQSPQLHILVHFYFYSYWVFSHSFQLHVLMIPIQHILLLYCSCTHIYIKKTLWLSCILFKLFYIGKMLTSIFCNVGFL